MSAHPYRSRRRPSRDDRQWVLAGILVTLVLAMSWVSIRAHDPQVVWESILLVVVVGYAPAFMLWRLRRRSSRSRSRLIYSSKLSLRGFSQVEIYGGQALPKICIHCGRPTKRVWPFRFDGEHREPGPYDGQWNPLLAVYSGLKFARTLLTAKLWAPIEKEWKRHAEAENTLVFKIPHCKSCASRHPIVQRHLDFHNRHMTIEAHPLFRSAMRNP